MTARPLPNLPSSNPLVGELFKDLAAIASNADGELVNVLFEARKDGNDLNVYIQKLPGYASYGNDAGSKASLGSGHYYKNDGTKKRFVVFDGASNSDIYEDVSGTWTAASRSLTALKRGFFCQYKDYLYYTNRTDAIQRYDGSSWSSLAAGTPFSGASNIAKFIVEYKNMLILANSVNNPNRLWVSDVNAPETVGASNYWDFPQGEITGVKVLGSLLVVYTRNTVNVMTGDSPSSMVRTTQPKSTRFGCLSHATIQEVETRFGKEHWFLSNGAVRAFNGEAVREVGYDYVKNFWGNINAGQYELSNAATYKNRYYLSVPWSAATNCSKILICDPRFNEIWTRGENWNAQNLDVFEKSGNEVLWWGEATADSVTYEYPSGYTTQKPSSSTAISMAYYTANLDSSNPFLIKKYKKIYPQIKAIGNVNLLIEKNIDEYGWGSMLFNGSTYINMSGNNPLWGTAVWGSFTWGGSVYVPYPTNRGMIAGKGKLIRYRITDSQTTGQTEVYYFQHFYIPKKVK